MYERSGDRKFDVETHVPVGRGYIVLDHPGVDLLQSGIEVPFAVEGDVPIGGYEMNIPALGKLVGTVRSIDAEAACSKDALVFDAILSAERLPGNSASTEAREDRT
ncbi:MAG: hypothetical protein QOC81_3344 [Thermoanaerobaculia bacterium]|nr:hypothetical protein [Thermoanaerobaculia bacterium]